MRVSEVQILCFSFMVGVNIAKLRLI